MNAELNFRQYKDEEWTSPQKIAIGSDWFVNWADFPTHAISGNQVLTSYLKKSASGIYTYDVFLSLQNLSGEKIKEELSKDGKKNNTIHPRIFEVYEITKKINYIDEVILKIQNASNKDDLKKVKKLFHELDNDFKLT